MQGMISVMGFLTALRLGSTPRAEVLASPWSEGQLSSIVWSDVFGTLSDIPLTRTEAMRVPAVAKARNLLVSTIAPLPLRVLDKSTDALSKTQPSWLSRTDSVGPWHRMAGTVDDLLFYGGSVWECTRGADGYPLTMDRIHPERWKITEGTILVDDRPRSESEIVYIPGPHEGLLALASRTIRAGRDQEDAWTGRVRNPIPAMELRETQDLNMEESEVKDLLEAWSKARRNPDGAVGFVPYGIELVDHGASNPELFVQGRNAIRTDIGAYAGIPSALMDASLSTSTLTYSTQEGQRSEYLTYTVPLWTAPIAERLSLDGEFPIVPRGQRVRLDTSDLIAPTASATGVPTDD